MSSGNELTIERVLRVGFSVIQTTKELISLLISSFVILCLAGIIGKLDT